MTEEQFKEAKIEFELLEKTINPYITEENRKKFVKQFTPYLDKIGSTWKEYNDFSCKQKMKERAKEKKESNGRTN